jgi:hypothetical protein
MYDIKIYIRFEFAIEILAIILFITSNFPITYVDIMESIFCVHFYSLLEMIIVPCENSPEKVYF